MPAVPKTLGETSGQGRSFHLFFWLHAAGGEEKSKRNAGEKAKEAEEAEEKKKQREQKAKVFSSTLQRV